MSQITTKNQKLIKIGNSFGITLDPDFIRSNNMQVGSQMNVRYHEQGTVTLVPGKNPDDLMEKKVKEEEKQAVIDSKVSPEFRSWVEKSLQEDEESLKALANL